MRRTYVQRSVGVLLLAVLLGGLLSMGAPGGAQTTRQVGTCIADAGGNIPAPNIPCNAKIPNDTLPGEYTLRASGNGVPGPGPSYPPQQGALTVSNNRLCANQETAVSGTGFAPNSLVTLSLERVGALAAGSVSMTGAAEAQEVIRTLTARITVVDCRATRTAAADTTTPASPRAAGGRTLSATGIDVARWLLIGGSLIGLGFGFVSAGRRKNRINGATLDS